MKAQNKDKDLKKNIGNYRIDMSNVIGEGPVSKVYLARDIHDQGIKRAVKIIPFHDRHEKLTKSVEEEIALMKKLSGPSVVQIYEGIITKHNIYIFEEYCEEGDLRKLMKLHPKGLPVEDCLHMIAKILKSYEILYKQNITLHSLKLENILIKGNMYKISNFSSAKCLKQKFSVDISSISIPVNVVKDQNYDVWGLGVIFYELLYGQKSFPDNLEDQKTIQWFKNNKIKYPHIPGCCEQNQQRLIGFLSNCLQIDQKKRYNWRAVYRHPLFLFTISHLPQSRLSSILCTVKISAKRQNIDISQWFNKYSTRLFDQQQFLSIMEILSIQVTKDDVKYLMKLFGKQNGDKLQIFVPDLKKSFLQAGIQTNSIKVYQILSQIFRKIEKQKRSPEEISPQKKNKQIDKINKIKSQPFLTKNIQQQFSTNKDIEKYEKIIIDLNTIIEQKDMDIFEVFLKNNKGRDDKLKLEELSVLIKNCGLKHSKQDIIGVFQIFDVDKSGQISYNQFYKTLCHFTGKSSRQSTIKIPK